MVKFANKAILNFTHEIISFAKTNIRRQNSTIAFRNHNYGTLGKMNNNRANRNRVISTLWRIHSKSELLKNVYRYNNRYDNE